jgi:hypothetical protein
MTDSFVLTVLRKLLDWIATVPAPLLCKDILALRLCEQKIALLAKVVVVVHQRVDVTWFFLIMNGSRIAWL